MTTEQEKQTARLDLFAAVALNGLLVNSRQLLCGAFMMDADMARLEGEVAAKTVRLAEKTIAHLDAKP